MGRTLRGDLRDDMRLRALGLAQLGITSTPTAMAAVKTILQYHHPGMLAPTPSLQDLRSRPKGRRDVVLDDLEPKEHALRGVRRRPPQRLRAPARWKQYHCLESFRLWWWRGDTGDFFFEDDAASNGWLRYKEPGSERHWYHNDFSGDWFFVDTGMAC